MADITSILAEAPGWLNDLLEIGEVAQMGAHLDFPKTWVWLLAARGKFSPENLSYDPTWAEWWNRIHELVLDLPTHLGVEMTWAMLPILGLSTERLVRRHLLLGSHMGETTSLSLLASFGELDAELSAALKGAGSKSAPGSAAASAASSSQSAPTARVVAGSIADQRYGRQHK